MSKYIRIQEALMAMPRKETVATKGPGQAYEQPSTDKFIVQANVPLNLDSYQVPPDGAKYKVHLDGPHPTVGQDVYIYPPDYEKIDQLLRITQNTALKVAPDKQAKDLSDSELFLVAKDSTFLVESTGPIASKCVQVTLCNEHNGRKDWWAFIGDEADSGHVELIGTEPDNKPADVPTTNPEQRRRGKSWITTRVPGISRLDMYDPVHAEQAPNIFWYELLHFDGANFRCPENAAITTRLVTLSKDLQYIRDHYGTSMTINSGYRDPVTNRRVGGARYSQHCQGRAADFTIAGQHPYAVNAWLCSSKLSQNGIASASCFTHFDCRRATFRWAYSF